MSEARVIGTLPVEEVGFTLFPNKPLKSRSKLNLLQFVKGGSSSYQSVSHAQTAPSSYALASLPLPPVQQPSSSLMSSGSTIPGVASGLSLETQYAASGSGHLVSIQGESSSYPAKLGVSGQSTGDGLHVFSSQETSVHQSAEASLPVFSQSISYSSSSAPGSSGIQAGSSTPFTLLGSTAYGGSSPLQDAASQFVPGSSSPYASVSLSSPQAGPSTTVPASLNQLASTFTGSSGTQAGSSTPFTLQRSTAYGGSRQPQDSTSQFAPGPQSPYASVSLSSPQAVASPSTVHGSGLLLYIEAALGLNLELLLVLPQKERMAFTVVWSSLKILQVNLPLDLNPPMQVYHCPYHKLVHLLLFRILGSSLPLPSQAALAPRQGPPLASPCWEALLMVDHLGLKMLLVSLSLGLHPHMQVCHRPHPKVLLVSPAKHIKAFLCPKARSLQDGSLHPLVGHKVFSLQMQLYCRAVHLKALQCSSLPCHLQEAPLQEFLVRLFLHRGVAPVIVALSNLKASLPSIPLGPSSCLMIQVFLGKVHPVLQLLRS
ncbi:uncharacterized protein LOC107678017 [Sinocyclocheilus anshuiensis]|uniref:uncharacterized protein LOC107678017 n=1 Tax=Sinocyclocheilus anshuiensis TaxID=1608454 RepID=UPI0007B850AD|nr:PREDICTED: uncharacterized protein LOC107678017 [Sinocyclocheilus anshuiensis]